MANIYDDVATLQEQVAALQTTVTLHNARRFVKEVFQCLQDSQSMLQEKSNWKLFQTVLHLMNLNGFRFTCALKFKEV
jgi:hypothetical protein